MVINAYDEDFLPSFNGGGKSGELPVGEEFALDDEEGALTRLSLTFVFFLVPVGEGEPSGETEGTTTPWVSFSSISSSSIVHQ